MLTVRVESSAGSEFIDSFREMKDFAQRNNVIALQTVNGIQVMIYPDSDPEQVLENYMNARKFNFKVVS